MPRMSIEVSNDLNTRLDKFLPWGTKQRCVSALLIHLCDAVDTHGKQIIGLILNEEWNLITKELKKKEETLERE